jgi:hypothetical protein
VRPMPMVCHRCRGKPSKRLVNPNRIAPSL